MKGLTRGTLHAENVSAERSWDCWTLRHQIPYLLLWPFLRIDCSFSLPTVLLSGTACPHGGHGKTWMRHLSTNTKNNTSRTSLGPSDNPHPDASRMDFALNHRFVGVVWTQTVTACTLRVALDGGPHRPAMFQTCTVELRGVNVYWIHRYCFSDPFSRCLNVHLVLHQRRHAGIVLLLYIQIDLSEGPSSPPNYSEWTCMCLPFQASHFSAVTHTPPPVRNVVFVWNEPIKEAETRKVCNHIPRVQILSSTIPLKVFLKVFVLIFLY